MNVKEVVENIIEEGRSMACFDQYDRVAYTQICVRKMLEAAYYAGSHAGFANAERQRRDDD
jgi:hypothetical protein